MISKTNTNGFSKSFFLKIVPVLIPNFRSLNDFHNLFIKFYENVASAQLRFQPRFWHYRNRLLLTIANPKPLTDHF
jgi:hypothetical protein